MFWIITILITLGVCVVLDRWMSAWRKITCHVDYKEEQDEPRQGLTLFYLGLKEKDGATRQYDVTRPVYESVELNTPLTVTFFEGWLFKTRYSMRIEMRPSQHAEEDEVKTPAEQASEEATEDASDEVEENTNKKED